MKTILALLLIITANYSFADGLYTGAWSYHFDRDQWNEKWNINEDNKLIAYQYKKVIVGHFYNSFGDSTALLNAEIFSYQFHDIKATIFGGATYGYSFCNGDKPKTFSDPKKICPNLMPEIKYTKYKLQPSLIGITNGIAVTFMWKIN